MRVAGINILALLFVLIAENMIVHFVGSSHLVANVSCVLAFVFFVISLSPANLTGFALTLRQWGDVFRRELLDDGRTFTDIENRRAAGRSLFTLTLFISSGFLSLFFIRYDAPQRVFLLDMSVLVGMESGFVTGYLVATRRRTSFS